MCNRFLATLAILSLIFPAVSLAQLSSENYVVEGSSISAPNTTVNASSSSFQNQPESGGLYIYDEPIVTPTGGGGGSTGTKVPKKNTPTSQVLGKLDAITICHSAGGQKYVTLSNVQVFITLAQSGFQAELRGHDGHAQDIAPSFLYDIGDGVKRYPGKNWTVENQILHANNCALFLAEPEPEPTDLPPPVPIQPLPEPEPEPLVPPTEVPVDICSDESKAVSIKTAIDENTLVEFDLPKGIARSRTIELSKSDYRLLVQVKPVSSEKVKTKKNQIENALQVLAKKAEKNVGNTEPYGLIKKITTQDVYTPPLPTFDTPTPLGGANVLTIGTPDCEDVTDVPLPGPADPVSNDSPNNDEDGDGIPNSQDPDDNNDGTPDNPNDAIIYAHKIICEDESQLPNWGNRGGPNITRSTAQTWVANNPGCRFASDWYFEWGEQQVRNPGDNTIGVTGAGWNVIGPTDENGLAYTVVTNQQIQNNRHFWFREVMKPGYLGYTYRYDRASYSAEMYCHSDVLNYDNFDRIDGIKTNNSFNCIAWNVATGITPPDDGVNPEPDTDSDGVPDTLDENDGFPDVDTDGDGIPDSQDENPNSPDVDTDGDGLPDSVDVDDNNDSIPDSPDEVVPPTDSEDDPVGTDEIIILVEDDEFTEDDIDTITDGELISPIEISVVDETGSPLDSFEQPVYVDIFNPNFVDAENIVILQPTGVEGEWYALPHTVNGDTVTIELIHPGEIFIWFKPKTALAAEGDTLLDSLMPIFSRIEVNQNILKFLEYLGFGSILSLIFIRFAQFPFSFTHIGRLLAQAWKNFFAFITFKKKRHPWGTVYDSKTKHPLDPAIIELYDSGNVKIDQAVTDLDGRYGFLVPVGDYRMSVKKTHYTFPAKMFSPEGDVMYHNLYLGGPVVVSDAIVNDIPLDPVAFDWNQYEKMRTRQTKFIHRFDPFFIRLLDVLSWFGFLLLVWQFISIPTIITVCFLAIYSLMLWRRFHGGMPLLYGFVEQENKLLPYALIQVFSGDREIARKVADQYGRYFVLVAPGKYTIKVHVPHGNDEYEQLITTTVKAKNGVINDNLRID